MAVSCACSLRDERSRRPPRALRIRTLTMGVHGAAAGSDPFVEQALHDRPLRSWARRGSRSSASSCGRRPAGRHDHARHAGEPIGVARRQLAPARDDRGQARQLLAPDRRLDVRHPVVEPQHRVLLLDHLRRPCRTVSGTLIPCCRSRRNRRSRSAIAGREHAAVAGRQQLARVKREAGHERRAAGRSAASVLATGSRCPPAHAASSITARPCRSRHGENRVEIARHPELVHAQNRPRPRADRRLDERRDPC